MRPRVLCPDAAGMLRLLQQLKAGSELPSELEGTQNWRALRKEREVWFLMRRW